MSKPLVIFRTGYMQKYDGPGKITGGGAHIVRYGEGGEMWNFLANAGTCYGYVMTRNFAGVNLGRIAKDTARIWRPNDELTNVDVVFIARKPTLGQVVIGWYRDATIFHRVYLKRPNPGGGDKLDYLCLADSDNVTLLPESDRLHRIPYAPSEGFGPGQSNVWYADDDDPKTLHLVHGLRRYIGLGKPISRRPPRRGSGWRAPLDKNTIVAIEKASMAATKRHFAAKYKLDDVCRDCRGWDITATSRLGRETLRLEVKGHLGSVIQFELTPNEFSKLKEMPESYRVCVVRDALKRSKVEVFKPEMTRRGDWILKSQKDATTIMLSPREAARANEVE